MHEASHLLLSKLSRQKSNNASYFVTIVTTNCIILR
jgi:hypothetical protein